MGVEAKQLTVPAELDGARLDLAVARLGGLSRSLAKNLIEAGHAGRLPQEGGSRGVPKERVKAGDVIWLLPAVDHRDIRPEQLPIEVLYEDSNLAIINKPAGMVTHPAPGNRQGTLVSALLNLWPQVEGVGTFPRWGIVHRLDKDTSGAMVVALDSDAYRLLGNALSVREVMRDYLTLVHGRFSVTTGTIEAPIDRHRARRFVGSGGRRAVTHYRRLAEWVRPSLSLLEVSLETGRTHQIRVHLESIRRHVVGDPVYGRPAGPDVDPGRQWLHAHRLRLAHPLAGGTLDVSAPLPADLHAGIAVLGAPDLGTHSF